jgi:hypothetical protein
VLEYWTIPTSDFWRRCPACGNKCTAERVRRTLSNHEQVTNDYAACCACSWEGFADMTRGEGVQSQ